MPEANASANEDRKYLDRRICGRRGRLRSDGDRRIAAGAMTVRRLRVLEARIEKLSIETLTVD